MFTSIDSRLPISAAVSSAKVENHAIASHVFDRSESLTSHIELMALVPVCCRHIGSHAPAEDSIHAFLVDQIRSHDRRDSFTNQQREF